MQVARVRELEAGLEQAENERHTLIAELHSLYYATFDAFKLKGIVEAAGIQEAAT